MRTLPSRVDRSSEAFQANHAAMSAAVVRLDEELAKSRAGGGEKYVQRHLEAGKLLPRERIELLLDRGFLLPGALPAGRARYAR